MGKVRTNKASKGVNAQGKVGKTIQKNLKKKKDKEKKGYDDSNLE